MNSGNPDPRRSSVADGNPEPSRRYTAGRCRDYLSAGVALNDRQERPAPHRGEEIVHSLRKRRGRGDSLVLGSSPSGPTTYPDSRLPIPNQPALDSRIAARRTFEDPIPQKQRFATDRRGSEWNGLAYPPTSQRHRG